METPYQLDLQIVERRTSSILLTNLWYKDVLIKLIKHMQTMVVEE